MKFTVLKGGEPRRIVLPPVPNKPQKAFTKTYRRFATAIKDHKTHEVYPVNKATAPDQRSAYYTKKS